MTGECQSINMFAESVGRNTREVPSHVRVSVGAKRRAGKEHES